MPATTAASSRSPLSLLLLAALAGPGCDLVLGEPRAPAWERERRVLGPIELVDQVAYVDTGRDQVVVVEPAAAERIARYPIGRDAVFAQPLPGGGGLAVLTAGEERLTEAMIDQEPALWIVETGGDAAPRGYPLGSSFDRVALAGGGEFAIAHFRPDGGAGDDGVFRNPNELAIVDLSRPAGDDNPVQRTLRSFGAAPDAVILSPPMTVPGAADPTPRVFAFVLARDTVTILDATHPERREVSVRIGGGDAEVIPRELAFAPAAGIAYLRSDGARDVLAIRLTGEAPDPAVPDDNDVEVAVAELGAGGRPVDIAVYDDADGRRTVLAAMPSRGALAVIDADTSEFVTVAIPDPIDRIHLVADAAGGPPRTALLAALGQPVPRVHLLGLASFADPLAALDLRTAALTAPVYDVVAIPGGERAIVVHDDARTVLGLFDLAPGPGFGAVAPLEGVGRLDTFDLSDDGRFLVGASRASPRVGILDLDTLHPSDVRLDDAPDRVFALAGGGVYVDHGDPLGRATYLPTVDATREQAVVLSGFLLQYLLDEED